MHSQWTGRQAPHLEVAAKAGGDADKIAGGGEGGGGGIREDEAMIPPVLRRDDKRSKRKSFREQIGGQLVFEPSSDRHFWSRLSNEMMHCVDDWTLIY